MSVVRRPTRNVAFGAALPGTLVFEVMALRKAVARRARFGVEAVGGAFGKAESRRIKIGLRSGRLLRELRSAVVDPLLSFDLANSAPESRHAITRYNSPRML